MATQRNLPTPGIPYRDIAFKLLQFEVISGYNKSQKENQPFIIDLVTLEKLYFQNIPPALDYNPESNFESIASPGRNTPIYQYSGAEDTLDFVLTWYADDESRLDVLLKCKWLEALGKNNGFDEPPHLVKLCFGELFSDAKWIVAKASYKLGRFQRPHRMYPAYAEQQITLKRVEEGNRTRNSILKHTT